MTKEDDKATIDALLEERRGYVNRGETERVAMVDAELKKLGASAEKPVTRSQKRPGRRTRTKR